MANSARGIDGEAAAVASLEVDFRVEMDFFVGLRGIGGLDRRGVGASMWVRRGEEEKRRRGDGERSK
ncbi:MAG: hypothetical protein ACO3ZY_12760, partial [Phycisphaerales bacterium]